MNDLWAAVIEYFSGIVDWFSLAEIDGCFFGSSV